MTLVLLVGISLFLSGFGVPTFAGVLILAIILMVSFLSHELAHKFVAQRNGMRAEFRVTPFGALLTFISIFSPFKFIAPGAVMITGYSTNRVIGRVAIVGPLTNILLGSGFVILSLLFTVSNSVSFILSTSAYINGFLAAFNLIPLSIIDGKKVFTWSKGIWALAFSASAALFLLALFVI
jgi:Zn-dependent protease